MTCFVMKKKMKILNSNLPMFKILQSSSRKSTLVLHQRINWPSLEREPPLWALDFKGESLSPWILELLWEMLILQKKSTKLLKLMISCWEQWQVVLLIVSIGRKILTGYSIFMSIIMGRECLFQEPLNYSPQCSISIEEGDCLSEL